MHAGRTYEWAIRTSGSKNESIYIKEREKLLVIADREGAAKRMRRQDELAQELTELNEKLTVMKGQIDAGNNDLVPQFNAMVSEYNTKAAEPRQINSEMITFYKYIDPDYQPPQQQ